jgi:hypothetical protein
MPDHDRQPRRVQTLVPEQTAARRAVRGGEPERHVEPDEQLAQLVRATVLERADDVEQVEGGFLVPGPLGQELADPPIQVRLQHPGLAQVVVGLAERHGLDDRAACRVVALHQEYPFRRRVQLVGAGQELQPGHLGHVVVDDQQRHGLVVRGQPPQRRQPCGGRRFAQYAEVLGESPAEVAVERAHDPGVVVEDEQDGA